MRRKMKNLCNVADEYVAVQINKLICFNINITFKILLARNVLAVPMMFSAGFIGSDVILRIGWWNNQYEVTIYCDIKAPPP